VKVTKEHNEDVKKLFHLMGVPVVEAPCEAEAQCASLCRAGKVFASATEDADALTFGSTNLVKNLSFSESKSKGNPIIVINLPTALEELELSMDQFVDFCILCGCDYCDTIRGIGALTAYKLIKQHKDIETVIQNIDKTKYTVPEVFPFAEARQFFHSPEVSDPEEVKLLAKDPDYIGLKAFLVEQNSFNETRVDNYIARLRKAKGKSSQMRLENFFGATTVKSSSDTVIKGQTKGAKGKAKSGPLQKRKSEVSSTTVKRLKTEN